MKPADNAVWTPRLVVGKIGRTGVETHAVRCETTKTDEGKPWANTHFRKAHTLCNSGRIGYRSPHSLQFNSEVNEQTVTCEHCRQYDLAKVKESVESGNW